MHTSEEITELLALERIDPQPDSWRQTARVCAVMASAWAGRKSRKVSEEDFMPQRKKRQTGKEIAKRMQAWAAGHNANIRKNRK